MHIGLGRSCVHVGWGRSCVHVGLIGEGCDEVVVWDSVVLICGVWLSSCVRGVGKGCGGIVHGGRWRGLTQWHAACFRDKANLFPHFSFGCHLDCVHCLNTTLWGLLVSFLPKFDF